MSFIIIKLVEWKIEDLDHYWIKNNRVVLGGGAENVITVTEDDQLTVSGHGFYEPGTTGEESWIYLVYGHCLNPDIRKVEVDLFGGETQSQEIDGLGGYIIPYKVKNSPGFKEIRGLDKGSNIVCRFPPDEEKNGSQLLKY